MENNKNNYLPITLEKITDYSKQKINSNSLDILFNLGGEQKVFLNNNIYIMGNYDIIVINPRDSYELFSSTTSLVRIRINNSILNQIDTNLPKIDCNSSNIKNKEQFHNIYVTIIKYIKCYKNISLAKAYSIAYEFIEELSSNFKQANQTLTSKSRFQEITEYIEKNYQDNLLLNDIAEMFNLSVPYLSKLFKQELGSNFGAYYDSLRINNSLYDLLNTELSILDIALKHGFANNQAYIRAYKRIFNELPSVTRQEGIKYETENNQESEIITFTSILKELEKSEIMTNDYKNYYLNVDYKSEAILKHKQVYNKVLGLGSAKNLLYFNIQNLIKINVDSIKYKYINIRGILSDEFSFVSRDISGKLVFRFNLLDSMLDFVLMNNLMPLISLTYMPTVLASDKTKVIYSEGHNASAPKNLDEWKELLETLFLHFIERYGKEKVSFFKIIPWVSPDSSYNQLGFKTKEEFYNFYLVTYKTLKNILPKMPIFSPEIFPDIEENFIWLKDFLKFTTENDCVPEALSLQYFSNDNWVQIQSQLLRGKFLHSIRDYGMKNDPNDMNKYIKNIYNYMEDSGYKLPIWITSYNYSIKRNNRLTDTPFLANYVIKNYVDNFEYVKSFTYWNLCDYENSTMASELFFGGSGQYFRNGIPKPQHQAYRFLCYIKDEIIARGDGYLLSRDKTDNSMYLLIYNYEHPEYNSENEDVVLQDDVYNVFKEKEKKKIHLKITNCNFKKAFFRFFILNKDNGSPYDKWIQMGKPNNNQYHSHEDIVYNILSSSSHSDYKELFTEIIDDTLSIDISLDPLEIKGIHIRLME